MPGGWKADKLQARKPRTECPSSAASGHQLCQLITAFALNAFAVYPIPYNTQLLPPKVEHQPTIDNSRQAPVYKSNIM